MGSAVHEQAAEARRRARRTLLHARGALGIHPDVRRYLEREPAPALNVGCGGALLDGWLNADRDPAPGAIHLDVTRRFRLPDGAFAHVFSEHVIEHVPLAAGRRMLRECARILRPGGRIRISTPDLERLVDGTAGKRYFAWAAESFAAHARGTTRAVVLNNAFRAWGHQFLYDEETLAGALRDAGFSDVRRLPYGISDDPAFAGIEGRGIDRIGIEMRGFETLALEAVRI
jgi:predicted SAM-dependent methyltransferase